MKTIRRRRREGKTDYKARLALIKSGKARLVVRKTNRSIIAQIVETDIAQDKIISGVTSHSLLAHGWPKELEGSLKSVPAAYLTGLLLGTLVAKKKVHEAILDIGMNRNVHKSRLYAVLHGALDAGIQIPHDKEALPSNEFKGHAKLSKAFESVKHALEKHKEKK
ncbi:50S ribosomal protein L18 [Candidatus Pacearchaeota archaeon]|nr:50S ribosomal protein L18 [Candidatus Pacearchaeota archaeon]